ncbi:YbhB/YbcL family Raf kinase inhibitor-like protein [Rhodobacteraceae bacterium RKSG542]|nr:YbhB/YbcL family Raf kinase inhibitor-like protein [Pseudovibrio flavus]
MAAMFTAPALSKEGEPATLDLTSGEVTNGETFKPGQIYNSWGCTGDNKSPELTWSNVPEGTKSFAVTMYDPDAPTGSGWWHWVVIDIPESARELQLDAGSEGGGNLPDGAMMLTNDFGFKGYGGACPPPNSKPHNYEITVYALDIPKIEVKPSASPAMAGYFILQHVLGKAVLTAPTNAR